MISESTIQEAIEREFQCNRCGNCCKGDGVVEFGEVEADRLAAHLNLTRREFVNRYAVRMRNGKWRLLDQENPEQWCIFLSLGADGLYGCAVNEAKPDQCRSFPARWRNSDSFQTCSGLRALMKVLREREKAGGG